MASSSYRIGRKRTAAAAGCSPESGVLKSLFDLRKRCSDPSYSYGTPQIDELVFFCCKWSQRIVNSLSKLIVRDGNRFPSIKFFDCDVSSPEFAEILSIIMNHNTTTKLVVKMRKAVGTRNESQMQFLPRCESTRVTPTLDESILRAISDGLSVKRYLKSLKISGLRIRNGSSNDDNHHWCNKFINNNHLLHLDLSDSSFSAPTMSSIANALSLNNNLQSVNLGGCSLTDQLLSQIIESVQEHPSLMKLTLSRNFLAKSSSTEALDAIAQLMKSKNSKLRHLDLSKQQHPVMAAVINDIESSLEDNETEEKLKVAFMNALNALSFNTTLRSINLSGNDGCFSELHSVQALSSCLASNRALHQVDISSCHLTPDGLTHLAQNCVPRCSGNLKSLLLFGDEMITNSNSMNDWTPAFLSLEKGLQSNSTIQSLGGFDVAMDSKTKSSLQYLLNVNRAGRRALQADQLPLGAWSNILARASRIEYESPRNDKNDDDSVAISTTTTSVLFTLLHGPSTLGQRR